MGLLDGLFGGGGSVNAAPLERATQEAIALQRQIYQDGKQAVQPWYQAGASGIHRLADLLGLSGGSVQSRQQIYEALLPHYTQPQKTEPKSGVYFLDGNRVYYHAESDTFTTNKNGGGRQLTIDEKNRVDALGAPAQDPGKDRGQDIVDHDALNKAVEAQLADQDLPADYGALMQGFKPEQLDQDPGYQFRLQEGMKGLERALAAQGKTLDPSAAKALMDYGQQRGAQEYAHAYNRHNIDQTNLYNRLAGIAGMGQQASAQQLGIGQNYANQFTQLQTGLAQAQIDAERARAAQPSMFDTLLGLGRKIGSAYVTGAF